MRQILGPRDRRGSESEEGGAGKKDTRVEGVRIRTLDDTRDVKGLERSDKESGPENTHV